MWRKRALVFLWNYSYKKRVFRLLSLIFFLKLNSNSFFKTLVPFGFFFYGFFCALEPLPSATKTTTWPLLIYSPLTISYKKFIFHFYYNKLELYVDICNDHICGIYGKQYLLRSISKIAKSNMPNSFQKS